MHTSIFQWSMARLVVENGYPKDMCYDENGLCVAYEDTIPGTMFTTTRRAYVIVLREPSRWSLETFAYQL